MIVGSVVGSVVAACLLFWLLLRWARRQAVKSSNERPLYRPMVQVEIPHEPMDSKYPPSFKFSPLEIDIASRYPDYANHPSASPDYSRIDLPSFVS